MPLSMDRWVGKVAVVTGASSGIGEAISRALVSHGMKVIGLARRKSLLDAISTSLNPSKGTFHPFPCDLSSEESILSAFTFAKTIGHIHVLVNNAGMSRNASLLDGALDDWRDVIDVNVLALCVATREAVKDMRENGVDGHVVHVNSLSGHRVTPRSPVYTASKFAVTALTETLRQELNALGSKVKVTSISPGVVKTEIFAKAGRPFPDIKVPLLPEDVADAVVYTLSTPSHVQVHEIMMRSVEQKD